MVKFLHRCANYARITAMSSVLLLGSYTAYASGRPVKDEYILEIPITLVVDKNIRFQTEEDYSRIEIIRRLQKKYFRRSETGIEHDYPRRLIRYFSDIFDEQLSGSVGSKISIAVSQEHDMSFDGYTDTGEIMNYLKKAYASIVVGLIDDILRKQNGLVAGASDRKGGRVVLKSFKFGRVADDVQALLHEFGHIFWLEDRKSQDSPMYKSFDSGITLLQYTHEEKEKMAKSILARFGKNRKKILVPTDSYK